MILLVIWENSENQFGRPEKIQQNYENFLKIPPPPSRKS